MIGARSRDSTAIPGRESPEPKPAATARPGRPRKDELRAKEPRRLQASMTLEEIRGPAEGLRHVKRNAKGHQESWTGYKLHGHRRRHSGQLPADVSPVHDSQAAIPLARLTASRVDSLYDLMAYDAPEIRAFSEQLGHVPINGFQRRMECLPRCYRERSTVERTVQGRVWRAVPEGSRPGQGVVPPDDTGILALRGQLMRLTL